MGKTKELLTVETLGVDKDTRAIDNGGVLLVTELDLVASQVTVGTTGLHLADGGGVKLELSVDTLDVLTDGQSSHAVSVVGNTTKLGRLAGKERLPPGSATRASVLSSPVDELSSVLIRTQEEDLLLAVKVDNGVLDTGGLGGQEKIKDTIDVLLESLASTVLLLGVQEDNTLGTTLRDILVLALLSAGKTVVLIEERSGVDAVSLLVARLDDSDTTSRDVLESEVETSRLGADDEEHAVEGLGVLDVGEERGVETEAQGNLCGCEVVGLEDGVVEDSESSKDHLVVLVVNVLGDLVLESIVGENLNGKAGGNNLDGVLLVLHKVDVGEGSVEGANETGVVLNNLVDVVRGESLGTETALQVREKSLLSVVLNIQQLGERGVLRTQSVEEVLDEDPSGVGVDGLLEAELSVEEEVVELVVGETVEKGDLLGDLVNGLVPRELVGVLGGLGGRSKVNTHDGDTVGELLEVLSGGGDTVVVVKVTEGREETLGCAGTESKNHSLLVGALDVEDLDDGTSSVNSELNDVLVDLLGVDGGLLEEAVVGDELEVGLLGVGLLRRSSKSALVDEIASESGLGLGAQESGRSESLNTVLA